MYKHIIELVNITNTDELVEKLKKEFNNIKQEIITKTEKQKEIIKEQNNMIKKIEKEKNTLYQNINQEEEKLNSIIEQYDDKQKKFDKDICKEEERQNQFNKKSEKLEEINENLKVNIDEVAEPYQSISSKMKSLLLIIGRGAFGMKAHNIYNKSNNTTPTDNVNQSNDISSLDPLNMIFGGNNNNKNANSEISNSDIKQDDYK